MELKQALENIKRLSHRLAEDEILCIREHKEEAIPTLLKYIKTVIDTGEDLPEDYMAHEYAMFLLAEFKVHEAFPFLLKYLEFDYDFLDWLISDVLNESFGSILASVATADNIPQIKTVIENTELDPFNRLAAATALQVLYVEGIYERRDYFEYLKFLLENFRDDTEFVSFIACDCAEVCADEVLPIIEKLFEDDLFDKSITSLEHMRQNFKENDAESALQKLKSSSHHTYIMDTVKSVGWWACFHEKPDFGRKVGRNEPCPCGSGKKYKKCCGY